MTTEKLAAGAPFPALEIAVLGGGTRSLSVPRDGYDWMLTVVYRGKHCPLCAPYLQELKALLPRLNDLGVDVLAVSADSADRAQAHMTDIEPGYDVGYGLTIPQMQQLGLYISGPRNGIDVEAPFAEPGLFVINDQGQLQIIDISNVPFARPSLEWIGKGIQFLRNRPEQDPAAQHTPINGTHA